MIKLFSLKQEKEKEASATGGEKKVAAGLIRMQKGEPPGACRHVRMRKIRQCLGLTPPLPGGAEARAVITQCV
jgi:hypothetical protein